jgi:hypothetical protein
MLDVVGLNPPNNKPSNLNVQCSRKMETPYLKKIAKMTTTQNPNHLGLTFALNVLLILHFE